MEVFQYNTKSPTSKSLYAYNLIKEKVVSGIWESGKKIVVNKLIKELNMSRRPIMDALHMLEVEGFLEIVPQSGCRVITFEKKEIIDQIMLSASLEGLSAELAAQRRMEQQIDKVLSWHESYFDREIKITDNIAFFLYNRMIHNSICEMTHSTRIEKEAKLMWDINDFFLTNVESIHLEFESAIRYHHEILLAIKEQDSKKAGKIMEEHMYAYINLLKNKL